MAGAFASAFSAALSAGTTLGATSLGNLLNGVNYSVKCGIEIENWTKWTLDEPSTYMNRGYVSTPAKTILPGSKEAVVTHKAGGTATGTSGTVAWNLGDTGKKVIVMWSAPFNHDHYSNWLAVDVQAEHTKYDFDRMYKGDDSKFARGEYYRTSNTITHRADNVEVSGSMGTNHTPTVSIIVKPNNPEDLAPALREVYEGMKNN